MRINRVYDRVTVQGEGPAAGRRCTFVRLWGCNLACAWCDSAQTWDTKGVNGVTHRFIDNAADMAVSQVARAVTELDVDLCVVTGGEPLLQGAAVADLARRLAAFDVATHVETNGTLTGDSLHGAPVELFVVSPKLPSAAAGPAERVLRYDVLERWARLGWRRAVFKFVVSDPAELPAVAALCDAVGVDRRARWVMPEGITPKAVAYGLAALTEPALAAGFNVTGRAHVMLWGNEEGR